MTVLYESSLFAIVLTLGAYEIGRVIQKKTKWTVANPLLIAIVLIVVVLKTLQIDNAKYQENVSLISFFLTPATVCLAIPLYRQVQILKKSLAGILVGILAGTLASFASVYAMCKLFSLTDTMTVSLLPKSITTAMGIVLSEQAGGFVALTAIVIVITGILGNMFGEIMAKIFHITDPVAKGVAYGTASHVVGTTKAAELDELMGAVSSLSLVVAGIITAVFFCFV